MLFEPILVELLTSAEPTISVGMFSTKIFTSSPTICLVAVFGLNLIFLNQFESKAICELIILINEL